jgi:hypothetical protein
MDEQIALILHADVAVYRPYLWTHIQDTIDDYKSSYEFFYPIVCYSNANAPAPASLGNSRHFPLRETGAAMSAAEEAGCDYALISPALTRLTEPLNILKPEHYDTGVCFVGSFQPRLYFGKVSKIKRIWNNKPWNPVNDLQTNFKYFYEDVIGTKINVEANSSVKPMTKEVMSIDLVKEVWA